MELLIKLHLGFNETLIKNIITLYFQDNIEKCTFSFYQLNNKCKIFKSTQNLTYFTKVAML